MSLPDRKYQTHKPQELRNLAPKARDAVDFADGSWVFQTKHDGCHVIVLVGINIVRIYSREGKECVSMPHIAEYFRLNSAPNMVYFGEVWNMNMEFKDISGMFRRQRPGTELQFWPFDSVTLQEFRAGKSERPYIQRLRALKTIANTTEGVIPVITHDTVAECQDVVDRMRAHGYKFELDGFMAKKIDGGWEAGVDRQGLQIKLKDVVSLDLECVGVIEGAGKFAGMVGALEVMHKGERVTVSGGKLTDAQRQTYWACANAVCKPHPNGIIGKIVEVNILGFTPDGKLREPRFQRVRWDKSEPSE